MRPLRPHHPPPDTIEKLFLILHQFNGFIVLILLGLRLMSLLGDAGEEKERLFPWLSAKGRQLLIHDLRYELPLWLHGKLKSLDEKNVIAATVHGLGICLALALGLSGMVVFLGTHTDGSMETPIQFVKSCHDALATLMWVFLFGHAGMALMHQLAGQQALRKIFRG